MWLTASGLSPASGREMTRLSPRGGWGQGSPRMWGFLHVHLFGSASHRSWPVYLSVPWWGWERPWRLHESFLAAAPRVPHPDWPMPVLQQFVQNSAGFFLTTFVASALKKKRGVLFLIIWERIIFQSKVCTYFFLYSMDSDKMTNSTWSSNYSHKFTSVEDEACFLCARLLPAQVDQSFGFQSLWNIHISQNYFI